MPLKATLIGVLGGPDSFWERITPSNSRMRSCNYYWNVLSPL